MLKLQLIGNLGQDAVVNNVGGKNVINFLSSIIFGILYKLN